MPRSQKVEFPGSQGGKLAALLELPDGAPRACALFAHCFTCSKDVFAAARIAGGLAEAGIAVLRFDFTGLGASEGEFANTNFSSNVDDLLRAAEYLRGAHLAPSILIEAVAGLALVGAFASSAMAAFTEAKTREAAAITFLVTASGVSFGGVSGAFWGLIAGGAMLALARFTAKKS